MSKAPHPRSKRNSTSADLSAPAHDQIMDYLKLAKSSTNDAFVAATLELAKERQRQLHRAEAKISPGVAITLGICVALADAFASWIALVHYPGKLGSALVGIVSAIALLVIGLIALLSGHLSQANFMTVVRIVEQKLSRINPFSDSSKVLSSISASKDNVSPPEADPD